MCGCSHDGIAGIVDLSASFGWNGSLALYGIFENAICHIVVNTISAGLPPDGSTDTTAYFAYAWVDDHVMTETDIGTRCATAEDALHLAMLADLGPHAINEQKFT
ncbi:hypothetical protein PHMEG_00020986 [Phytophthora megakarya]|uniref:Uncharacterized protein n=1 Tax=Phytophthora megakarya TaxID=4795 RepID=A0A225VN10_9STRA|nr:hypothetical protein PHMEG_00020986 [Phytophthora megakarya]